MSRDIVVNLDNLPNCPFVGQEFGNCQVSYVVNGKYIDNCWRSGNAQKPFPAHKECPLRNGAITVRAKMVEG